MTDVPDHGPHAGDGTGDTDETDAIHDPLASDWLRGEDEDAASGPPDPTLAEALPGLARIGLRAGLRTLAWMAGETRSTGEAVAAAVAEGQSPVPVVRDAGLEAWEAVARGLGRDDAGGDETGPGDAPGGPGPDRGTRRPTRSSGPGGPPCSTAPPTSGTAPTRTRPSPTSSTT